MNLEKLSSLKIFLFFTFLLCISCNDAQKENDTKIYLLLQKARLGTSNFDYAETIKYAKEAETLALKTNSTHNLPSVYLEIADALSGLELQKESLSYLDKILKMDFEKKDKLFKARVYKAYAYNYNELGLATQFLNDNKKAIQLLANSKTYPEVFYLAQTYGDIGYYYYSTKNPDSSFYYYQKEENTFKLLPAKYAEYAVHNLSALYNTKGYIFLEQKKQSDSALYYFQKGYDFKKSRNDNYLDREYLSLGDYYFTKKNYPKALENYLKAQENVKQYNSGFNENNDINKVLADTYKELKNLGKQSFYLNKYTKFNDSVQSLHKINLDGAVNVLVNKKAEETSSVKKSYTVLFSVLSVLILISSIFLYFYLKKKKTAAVKTEELLLEKEEENQDLKQKVNESFEEVVQLAKDNSPEFLTRFNEVYPAINKKLLDINPALVASELRFCAMLFLNFSTKDIAEYTFTSPRTVQNRKNSIRKKLNISSVEDVYIWFKNL